MTTSEFPVPSGPQVIPRPELWELGGLSPWWHLDDRSLRLEDVETAIRGRKPSKKQGVLSDKDKQDTAVLVSLCGDKDPHVILTRRSATLRFHKREMSFPGGKIEVSDPNLWFTACREASEETGLITDELSLLGCLDPHITATSNSVIHPYVTVLGGWPDLTPNLNEVEVIRYVPLSELVNNRVWREEIWNTPMGIITVTFFVLDGDTVWGATAAILRQLLSLSLDVPDNDY